MKVTTKFMDKFKNESFTGEIAECCGKTLFDECGNVDTFVLNDFLVLLTKELIEIRRERYKVF